MEKKTKNRDLKKILLSIFKNIDQQALREILDRPSSKMGSINNLPFVSDEEYSNQDLFQDLSIDNNGKKKVDQYLKVVRKAVTTQNLPSINSQNLILSKSYVLPSFLKRTFKTIASRLNAQSDSLNKPTSNSFSKKDIIFIINVSGSQDSKYSYDFTTKKLSYMNENHKFIFSFILPTPEEDKTNNYRNRKDIIINEYLNNMRNLDIDKFYFLSEERNTKNYSHPIHQVENVCSKFKVQYLICGFTSLKGPKGDNKLLEKGLTIMLKNYKTSFIIIKESLFQNPESSLEGFNWLFIFDKININCFNAFKNFSQLVDFSKDKITGLTMLPHTSLSDDIEPLFMKEFANKPNAKYQYEMQRYQSEPFIFVNNKVNFGETRYDFVVLYNNNLVNDYNKTIIERQFLTNISIILGSSSNLCVMNGI